MLGNKIEQALKLDYEQQELRDYIGISQIGYCPVKLFRLHSRKEKVQVPTHVLFSFMIGRLLHEGMQKLLWKYRGQLDNFTYYKAEKEVELKTDKGNVIKGHTDLFARIDNEDYVADFKFLSQQAFINQKEIPEHYKAQLSLYAYALGLKKGIYTIYNKNKFQYKDFIIEVDELYVQQLLDKYDMLINALETGIEPDKPFETSTDSWECGYCQYYNECWGKKEYILNGETIEISPLLAKQYAELLKEKKEIDEEIKTLKEVIEEELNGANGTSPYIRATFIQPKPTIKFDDKTFRKENPELFKAYQKEIQRKPYYKITILTPEE